MDPLCAKLPALSPSSIRSPRSSGSRCATTRRPWRSAGSPWRSSASTRSRASSSAAPRARSARPTRRRPRAASRPKPRSPSCAATSTPPGGASKKRRTSSKPRATARTPSSAPAARAALRLLGRVDDARSALAAVSLDDAPPVLAALAELSRSTSPSAACAPRPRAVPSLARARRDGDRRALAHGRGRARGPRAGPAGRAACRARRSAPRRARRMKSCRLGRPDCRRVPARGALRHRGAVAPEPARALRARRGPRRGRAPGGEPRAARGARVRCPRRQRVVAGAAPRRGGPLAAGPGGNGRHPRGRGRIRPCPRRHAARRPSVAARARRGERPGRAPRGRRGVVHVGARRRGGDEPAHGTAGAHGSPEEGRVQAVGRGRSRRWTAPQAAGFATTLLLARAHGLG